ncbi:MAG: MalT-like region [Gaiellales bacterium]|jgi:tetratricopeptide (TPR) repeat protein|nr:MalT-like region [Gaiellales bacterium]
MPDDLLADASLLIGLSRFDEAEDALRLALRDAEAAGETEGASMALEGLGTIATRRGQEARALELFELAISTDNPDPVSRQQTYTELARLRSYCGDSSGAIELLEDCLGRVADGPNEDAAVMAHYAITLNYAYADDGQYGKAGTLLAGVLKNGGEDLDLAVRARLYFALARLSINTGRTTQAVEYADRMLESALAGGSPLISDAYLMCAHTRLDAGDTTLAGRHLEEARHHAPDPMGSVDEGFLLVEEARHALQEGDHDLAVERARAAIELLGDQSVPGALGMAYLVIARAYDAAEDDDRADRAYNSAIDQLRRQSGWPTDLAKAYRRYGKFLRRRGRTQAAIEMLEAAAEITPD